LNQPFAYARTLAHSLQFQGALTHERQTGIMKTRLKTGLKIRTIIKAGGFGLNHNRGGLKVRVPIKAGGFGLNHNRSGIKVKAQLRAGYTCLRNHNTRLLAAA
jgi:hypothetical protein